MALNILSMRLVRVRTLNSSEILDHANLGKAFVLLTCGVSLSSVTFLSRMW